MMDATDGDLYLTSMYWAITTLSTVGYGDIRAETIMERLISMFWMVFGVLFFSFTISSLANMLATMNTKDNALTSKFVIIDEFCKDARLGKELKNKLKYALKYSTEKTGYSWAER